MSSLVVHFEIHASQPERLIDFYAGLFGWEFTRYGELPYWSIATGPEAISPFGPGHGINGGLTQRQGPAPQPGGPVSGANVVVAVEDTDSAYARGLALGGTEAIAPADLPGIGRLAYLMDPDGNVFGILAPVMSDGTNRRF